MTGQAPQCYNHKVTRNAVSEGRSADLEGSGSASEEEAYRQMTSGYGRLLVVSGPSGVGKDTLLERLFIRVPHVARSVSATTRAARPGEVDGVDYHFLARSDFETRIQEGYFLEYAQYGDHLYGTPCGGVASLRARGLDVVLKIEVQGALIVRRVVPDAVLIFIQPPSVAELERRLYRRNTEPPTRIAERVAIARAELAHIPDYDYLITNENMESAAEVLCAVTLAERHRIRRPREQHDFARELPVPEAVCGPPLSAGRFPGWLHGTGR